MISLARRHLGIVAVVAGGLTALGVMQMALHADSTRTPPPLLGESVLDFESQPLGPVGERVSDLSETQDLPFSVILPKEDSSGGVQAVWMRRDDNPGMAVRYESGVTILERVAEDIDFPTDDYYKQLVVGVPGGSVTTINRAPAMVIQSTEQLGNPSSVDVILQGVHISIIGNVGQDSEELIELASTFGASGAGKPLDPK